MKRKILTILLLVFCWGLKAQQRPQFTQYMVNSMLINPSAIGAYDYTELRAGFRNQWTGFEDAPRTFFLTGNARLPRKAKGPLPTIGTVNYGKYNTKKGTDLSESNDNDDFGIKHGLGGLMFYDQTGPTSRLMAYLNYAIHIPVYQSDKRRIYTSIGLQGGIVQNRVDYDRFRADPSYVAQINDPALGAGVSTATVPDLGLGITVYDLSKFYVGFSMNQVLQSEFAYSDAQVGQGNKLFTHYYISGGYKMNISSGITFIPSALIKFLEASPPSVDLNARIAFDIFNHNHLWTGVSYRHQDAFAGLLGITLSRWVDLNYSYDFTITKLSKYNSGSHEISLGLRLGRQQNYQHNIF
jgi:type IX secretion system PorP/SprF family membrane protein